MSGATVKRMRTRMVTRTVSDDNESQSHHHVVVPSEESSSTARDLDQTVLVSRRDENDVGGYSTIRLRPQQPQQQENFLEHRQQQRESHSRRELQKVIPTDDGECNVTTMLRTDYNGVETATGIMFTVKGSSSENDDSENNEGEGEGNSNSGGGDPLYILTIEFQINSDSGVEPGDPIAVKVFGRSGGFSEHMDVESDWDVLADTDAYVSTDGTGAIVPAQDFEPVIVPAGEKYAFYLTTIQHSAMIKLSPVETWVGGVSAGGVQEDDPSLSSPVEVHTGVSLTASGLFPSSYEQAANFNGIIHYRLTQPCDDARIKTDIMFEFAINDDPNEDIINTLNDSIESSMKAIMTLTPPLSTWKRQHSLEIVGVQTSFQGRSEQKCPSDFGTCSLLHTTITFAHLDSLLPGTLQVEILSDSNRLIEATSAQFTTALEYVGDPMVSGVFKFTLEGVPDGEDMTESQKLYFERVTSDYLRETSDNSVYSVTVTDFGRRQRQRQRQMSLLPATYLRGSVKEPRLLQPQASGTVEIITDIVGTGTNGELRSNVVGGIGSNGDRYINELMIQQLRPAEITPSSGGSFFISISGAFATVATSSIGGISAGGSSSGGGSVNGGVVICAVGLVLSLIYLFYRVYRDFISPPEENDKIQNQTKPNGLLSRLQFWKKDECKDADTDKLSMEDGGDSNGTSTGDQFHARDSLINGMSERFNLSACHSMHERRPGSAPDLSRFIGSSEHPRPRMTKSNSSASLDLNLPRGTNQAGLRGRGIQPSKSLSQSFQKRSFGSFHGKMNTRTTNGDDEDSMNSEESSENFDELDEFAEDIEDDDDPAMETQSNNSEDSDIRSNVITGHGDKKLSEKLLDRNTTLSLEDEESSVESDIEIPLAGYNSDDSEQDEENVKPSGQPTVSRKKSSQSLPEMRSVGKSSSQSPNKKSSSNESADDAKLSPGIAAKESQNQSGKNGRSVKKSKSMTEIETSSSRKKKIVDEVESSSDESSVELSEESEEESDDSPDVKPSVKDLIASFNHKQKPTGKKKGGKKKKGESSLKKSKKSKLRSKSKKKKHEVDKESKKNKSDKKDTPVNQAGSKGRGVAPSKSLPMFKSRFAASKGATIEVSDDSSDVSSITMNPSLNVTRPDKESRAKMIRDHLRDYSAPPVDLAATIFQHQHMTVEEEDDDGQSIELIPKNHRGRPTVKKSHSAENMYGSYGKIQFTSRSTDSKKPGQKKSDSKQSDSKKSDSKKSDSKKSDSKKPDRRLNMAVSKNNSNNRLQPNSSFRRKNNSSAPDLSLRHIGKKTVEMYKEKLSASQRNLVADGDGPQNNSINTSQKFNASWKSLGDDMDQQVHAERRKIVKDHLLGLRGSDESSTSTPKY
mmetsp:Transcript_31700/g.76933  ORF Transcript_31700/g.76933 Transcript_31700/m.76933 type:complete len:1366 (+) Transcript_31700:567-4664(+)